MNRVKHKYSHLGQLSLSRQTLELEEFTIDNKRHVETILQKLFTTQAPGSKNSILQVFQHAS